MKVNRFPKRIASALRGITFAIIWALRIININFFLQIGRFIFPPLNAAVNIFMIIFTLYELYKKPSKENLINTIFETITGACIVVGLIGSLIIGGPFEILAVPILLITCFSLRAFKSIYDINRHNNTFNEKLPNILNLASGIISAVFIALICFAGIPGFGILGILAGILSATAAILLIIEQKNKPKELNLGSQNNLAKLTKTDLQENPDESNYLGPRETAGPLLRSSYSLRHCLSIFIAPPSCSPPNTDMTGFPAELSS